MAKRSGTVSGKHDVKEPQTRHQPTDQARLAQFEEWNPSQIKTGLRNRRIGKKSQSEFDRNLDTGTAKDLLPSRRPWRESKSETTRSRRGTSRIALDAPWSIQPWPPATKAPGLFPPRSICIFESLL